MPRGAASEARYRARRAQCAACGKPKPSGQNLCVTCWALVPAPLREDVTRAYAALRQAQDRAARAVLEAAR